MKNLMEKVINKLTDRKAEADLIYSTGKSLKMSAQKGKISEYKVSSSQILGIRVIKDEKVGTSYTESLDDESLDLLINQALENAEMSEANPHEKILKLTGELKDEASYGEAEVDIAKKTQLALDLEEEVRKSDARITAVPYNSYSDGEYFSAYLSSRGRYTTYADKSYGITTSALMDENGKKAMFYHYQPAHRFTDLDFKKVKDYVLFHTSNLLKEETIPTGKYPVIFDEDSLRDLIGCFSNFYSAKSALDKVNPWAEKLGEKVTSSDLTITDDPQFDRTFRKSLFDSEGVEQKKMNLVTDGVLNSFYHNSVTASKMGTETTGHASRSAGGPLGVGGTTMLIQGKNQKPMPNRYLEVMQMDGLYSGANRVTGTFSAGVKGYLWENGERKKVFGNVTLSGNLLELLNRAEVVGTDLKASSDLGFFTVPLIFHDLSIAGS